MVHSSCIIKYVVVPLHAFRSLSRSDIFLHFVAGSEKGSKADFYDIHVIFRGIVSHFCQECQ